MDGRLRVFMVLIVAILEGSNGCEENATRLLEVQNKFKGLVEVCQGGIGKTVCNRGWDNKEARVVCRQLGFAEDTRADGVINARSHFKLDPRKTNQEVINVVWECTGNEQQLLDCPQISNNQSSCTETGVYCYGRTPDNCQEGSLRLVNGSTIGVGGRVEVCLDGFWGTVCDDGWDMNDATTVCKQLGLSAGEPTIRAVLGEGRGPVHLSGAGCTSEDMNLLNCAIDKSAVNECDHSQDAGVICSGPGNCSDGDVRLMGGENKLEGRVELCYYGVWATVCDNGWDERDAAVVCNQLGFGQSGVLPVNQSFGAGMGPILLDNVTCDQSHLELLQCVHPQDVGVQNCDRENVAGVICPNVSTTTITSTAAVTTFQLQYSNFGISLSITYTTTSEVTPQNNVSSSTVMLLSTNIINSTLFIIASTTSLQLFASNTPDASTSEGMTVQSAAVFGAVGGALAVVMVAIVLIVVVTAVMIVTKRRKSNHQDAAGKGALDNPIYDGSTASVGAANLDASSQEVNDHASNERDFQNPLYSETGPPCYQNTASKLPEAEGEYEGLYSDCMMNGEALDENTQNGVVQGALTSTNGNIVHVTASGACMYGNNMQGTLDSIDE